MSKTIIIGAGINGLLLGAMLSHDGDEVTFFEKNKIPGGRAFLYERDGYVLDYGIHLTRFGPKSALAKIMKYIGKDVKFKKMGNSYVIYRNGQKFLFPTSPVGIFKSKMFSLTEKFKLIGLFLEIKRGKDNKEYMDVSLRDWMNKNNITGGIRKYLELVSASVMVCPFIEKASVGEMFRNMYKVLSTGHSAEYLTEGWKPVYKSLIDKIEKNGKIYYGKKVEKVLIKKGKAIGVTAGGKDYKADRVIINLPVQEMLKLLPLKILDKGYMKLCKNLVPTSGIFFDIALKNKISDIDGLIYTCSPITFGLLTSNLSKCLAPDNGQILTMLYPTTLEDIKDTKRRERRKKELWKAIKRYFPDIEKHILWKRESCIKMIDGVQVNTDQTEDLRPGSTVPGIDNLFLVGDSIAAPGAGGDVGNESVLITFKKMIGRKI